MNTHTHPDTHTLNHLDFQPKCEVIDGNPFNPTETHCQQQADWIGTAPCGHDSNFCNNHKQYKCRFRCNRCGSRNKYLHQYRWIKI
jgi:hypothetical protein